jgi:hypothetical protein
MRVQEQVERISRLDRDHACIVMAREMKLLLVPQYVLLALLAGRDDPNTPPLIAFAINVTGNRKIPSTRLTCKNDNLTG